VKLALVTEIPAPFRIPLFNELAERVDLRVFFLAEHDPRRPHYRVHRSEMRFSYGVLRGRSVQRGGRWLVASVGTRRELRRFAPDVVVVGGWNQPAMWSARTLGRPTLVWVESTERDERPAIGPLERLKRRYLRTAAGTIVPGTASARYARSLGVPDERIHVAPNAVDARIFDVVHEPHDGCVFLYVGRLDREKGLDVLLDAFADVPGELVLVGDGGEAESLRSRAPQRVTFAGAHGRDELPAYYARADVFVLPSFSEPWGMVLNEAAAAGLPLVGTDAAGAALDLIEHASNGFRVAAGDVEELRTAMSALGTNPDLRARFGTQSREIAARFTPARWADAVADAARRVS
jgi:glycosyltransferase involved in cell wall biosynthesis